MKANLVTMIRQKFSLEDRRCSLVGRDSRNYVVIGLPEVSRIHLIVFEEDGRDHVANVGINGTTYDGEDLGWVPGELIGSTSDVDDLERLGNLIFQRPAVRTQMIDGGHARILEHNAKLKLADSHTLTYEVVE